MKSGVNAAINSDVASVSAQAWSFNNRCSLKIDLFWHHHVVTSPEIKSEYWKTAFSKCVDLDIKEIDKLECYRLLVVSPFEFNKLVSQVMKGSSIIFSGWASPGTWVPLPPETNHTFSLLSLGTSDLWIFGHFGRLSFLRPGDEDAGESPAVFRVETARISVDSVD